MIHIFTQRDPFFTDEFLREFENFNVPYIIYDMPNFKTGKRAGIQKAITLYGFWGFLKLLCMFFLNQHKTKFNNAQHIYKIQNEDVSTIFENMTESDVILSLSAPTRLPVEKLPPGILKLNFHCGRLPTYAGMMPIFWQLYNNEKEITITAHNLADTIDTGSIIGEYTFQPSGSFFDVSQYAKRRTAHIFYELLNQEKAFLFVPSEHKSKIVLTTFPNRNEVKRLKKKIKLV